ncbi:MAG TPA: hypothetical protein VLC91_04300 [Spongiibacteraceae bacterium]|nr:hypothetical protein [Spongiibacteraceae bacterium]
MACFLQFLLDGAISHTKGNEHYRQTRAFNRLNIMEHRHSNRAERGYFVLIIHEGEAVAIGKTKNIGKYGAFVRTDYSARLRQPLDIQFAPKGQILSPRYRVKTEVVRQAIDGFGVEIVNSNK